MWKRLSVIWLAVRGDGKRLWYALGHPQAPSWLKVGTAAIVLYLLSPIDLIPDMLPLVGVLDDLVIVPLALRWLLARLPTHVRQFADQKAGGHAAAGRPATGWRQRPKP